MLSNACLLVDLLDHTSIMRSLRPAGSRACVLQPCVVVLIRVLHPALFPPGLATCPRPAEGRAWDAPPKPGLFEISKGANSPSKFAPDVGIPQRLSG